MSDWSEELEAELVKLAKAGVTRAKIASILNGRYRLRLTRNAIIGKLRRLGVRAVKRPGKPPKPKPARVPAWEKKREEKPKPPPQSGPVGPTPFRKGLVEGEPLPVGPWQNFPPPGGCKWPHGHPGDRWRMCGAKQKLGHQYCDFHVARSRRAA